MEQTVPNPRQVPRHRAACRASSPGAGSSVLGSAGGPGDGWGGSWAGVDDWKNSSSALPSLLPGAPQPWHCGCPCAAPFSWIPRRARCPWLGRAAACPGPARWQRLAPCQLWPGISLVDVSVSGPTWPGPGSHRATPLPAPSDAPHGASFITPQPTLSSLAQGWWGAPRGGSPRAPAPANAPGGVLGGARSPPGSRSPSSPSHFSHPESHRASGAGRTAKPTRAAGGHGAGRGRGATSR